MTMSLSAALFQNNGIKGEIGFKSVGVLAFRKSLVTGRREEEPLKAALRAHNSTPTAITKLISGRHKFVRFLVELLFGLVPRGA